jgi:hypothetical protein
VLSAAEARAAELYPGSAAERVVEQLRVRERAAEVQAGVAAAVASAREALARGYVRAQRETVDPSGAAAIAAAAQAAWGALVSTPEVARLLEAASPAARAGLARLAAARDALVAAPLYSRVRWGRED